MKDRSYTKSIQDRQPLESVVCHSLSTCQQFFRLVRVVAAFRAFSAFYRRISTNPEPPSDSMITYELCLLLRIMSKPQLTTVLKRNATAIFDKGGVIRRLNFLGTRDLPYKMSQHGVPHRRASYFMLEFNAPPTCLEQLTDECQRDVDIVRMRLYKRTEPEPFECTLHEELLPPPYRKSVQELIKQARRFDKPKFNYNTGLDYFPFQK